ncbi:SDR family NAD(P)-dependent oxidoreductase [Mesorhizobium amorphae]|uniref:SDR family NAD(P)-dependent oxidoreductase n=1 Tax=Mesorhizobium amorphae TaxID=71433 RepID=UPI001AEEA323|nr:SDR family oxidoreductase [Mesorhizobium amorphae]
MMVDAAPISLPAMPSFRLDGRRALVTGAGRGIGAALASALAEAGAEVVLAARSTTEIEDVAIAIRARGDRAAPLTLDVTDVAGAREILAVQPAFHVLVSNAGTNRPKPIAEVTEDDYHAVLDLNLKASFFVSQTVAKRMAEDAIRGSIIFMSSQMGHVGAANRTLYCASKHAVEGLTKAMAVELGPMGIRVNTIAPTFVETPMTQPFLKDPVFSQSVLAKIRLGRLGRVEDLMGAAVYLASDASALVTGTSLVVDGGWTAE